jgi:hypothetical protein
MQQLSPGTFQGNDGEVITIDVQSTGAPTQFGVRASRDSQPLPINGHTITFALNKNAAPGSSFLPNAKSSVVTLAFAFTSQSGGKYEASISGSAGGGVFKVFANQVGNMPEAVNLVFHIV